MNSTNKKPLNYHKLAQDCYNYYRMQPPARYKFDDIFSYDPINGILIPRFNTIISTTRLQAGIGVTKNSLAAGLNLFNYVGKDIAARWNPIASEMTIVGFYNG